MDGRAAPFIVGSVLVVVVPVGSAPAATPTCFGRAATIVVSSEDEKTRGTPRSDVIVGSNRRDRILGLDGHDRICGRGGEDSIHSNLGDDRIAGGRGSDHLHGGPDDNRMRGGAGGDSFTSFGGDDAISGGTGRFDTVSYEKHTRGGITVDLRNRVQTGWGTDSLHGIEGAATGYGRDEIIGDARSNLIYVENYGDRREHVSGGGGRDLIHVMSGTWNYVVRGGRGRDRIGFSWSDSVDVDLGRGRSRPLGSRRGLVGYLFGLEDVDGSHAEDVIRGDHGRNRLRGLGGNDRIFGLEGKDFLNGFGFGRPEHEGRDDVLDGGPGRDTCRNGVRFRSCERKR